jgi:hypothetical protein
MAYSFESHAPRALVDAQAGLRDGLITPHRLAVACWRSERRQAADRIDEGAVALLPRMRRLGREAGLVRDQGKLVLDESPRAQ